MEEKNIEEFRIMDALLRPESGDELAGMEAALKEVKRKAVPSGRRFASGFMGALAVAASIALAFVLVKSFTAPAEETVYRFANVDSVPMKVSLPDGSDVWLKAGSELEYDKSFSVSGRSVRLDGEAYFDVARNPGMPFYVNTASLRIKVLGTVFNVKDRKSSAPEVVLAKGSVVMQNSRGENILRLSPGQKAEWDGEEGMFEVQEAPASNMLLQNYGIISLRDVTASEIAALIESTFGVKLRSEGTPSSRTYDFNFQKDSTPASVVDLLNFICREQNFVIE